MNRMLYVAAAAAGMAMASTAVAQVTFHTGTSEIVTPTDKAVFCCLDTFDDLNGYTEAGLLVDINNFHFRFTPCGFSSSQMYYPNTGTLARIDITRIDGNDFDVIEMDVSHGFAGCTLFVWISAYQNGAHVASFDADVTGGTLIGLSGGGYDEVRVGSYGDAATRNAHIESNHSAIAIDSLEYGTGVGGGLAIDMDGTCPGPVTLTVTGASVTGVVAIVYSQAPGTFTIPGGQTCGGTVLGLAGPVQIGPTDNSGGTVRTFSPTLPRGACGLFIQAIDATSCNVSNVLQIL